MPYDRTEKLFSKTLSEYRESGRLKGRENVIVGIIPASDGKGPRYLLEGEGDKPFLRMNANNYLGMALHPNVVAAEEAAIRQFGIGPGAVRFISGAYAPHVDLEQRLAKFHERPAAMIFSSAYAAVMGILPPLIDAQTAVISDALNHNCIINAMRLARPKERRIYPHLDMAALEKELTEAANTCDRAIIVTDGVFSMRGDHAPLDRIEEIAKRHDANFKDNVLTVVDDSHGVGALGVSGRGVEEHVSGTVDLLIATLGKSLGVNGGYVVSSEIIINYLRETSPFYIFSNPITPGEAAAAKTALDILDCPYGAKLLEHLRDMTARFRRGIAALGYESVAGEHPVTPVMLRSTRRTTKLVRHLHSNGILATGINYPVVPQGDEEIRFQVSADHTARDIDEALAVLERWQRPKS